MNSDIGRYDLPRTPKTTKPSLLSRVESQVLYYYDGKRTRLTTEYDLENISYVSDTIEWIEFELETSLIHDSTFRIKVYMPNDLVIVRLYNIADLYVTQRDMNGDPMNYVESALEAVDKVESQYRKIRSLNTTVRIDFYVNGWKREFTLIDRIRQNLRKSSGGNIL